MKNVIFITMLVALMGTILYVALHIPIEQQVKYYYLDIDEVDDNITLVYVLDECGEAVALIDDDLYRHGDYLNKEWLRDSIETSMGFKTILECSERYYLLIYNKNN